MTTHSTSTGETSGFAETTAAIAGDPSAAGHARAAAEILVDALDQLTADLCDEAVIARAVLLAETEPVGTFRRAMRTLVEKTEAASLEERYRRAVRTRRVVLEPGHIDAPKGSSTTAPRWT